MPSPAATAPCWALHGGQGLAARLAGSRLQLRGRSDLGRSAISSLRFAPLPPAASAWPPPPPLCCSSLPLCVPHASVSASAYSSLLCVFLFLSVFPALSPKGRREEKRQGPGGIPDKAEQDRIPSHSGLRGGELGLCEQDGLTGPWSSQNKAGALFCAPSMREGQQSVRTDTTRIPGVSKCVSDLPLDPEPGLGLGARRNEAVTLLGQSSMCTWGGDYTGCYAIPSTL